MTNLQRNTVIKRILIVGFGSIGQLHFRIASKKYPDAIIKVFTKNLSNHPDIDDDHRVINLNEALKFSPQLTVISNPSSMHIKMALPFAKIGSHLLIEKPISSNEDNIADLIATCKRSKSIVAVGYNLRFLPSLKYFKKTIDSNVIGQIYTLNFEFIIIKYIL